MKNKFTVGAGLQELLFPTEKWRGFVLPQWLFHQSQITSKSISPAACFNPAKALSGTPWAVTTRPNEAQVPKTLILDCNVYIKGQDKESVLAQISWLKRQGISVYLCVKIAKNKEFISTDVPNIDKIIDKLVLFNEPEDYELCCQSLQIPRDKLVALNEKRAEEFYNCMHYSKIFLEPVYEEERYNKPNPYLRRYEVGCFEVYIPGFSEDIRFSNPPTKRHPGTFENSQEKYFLDEYDEGELLHNIEKYPHRAAKLIVDSQSENPELDKIIFHTFPDIRHLTMPACFRVFGPPKFFLDLDDEGKQEYIQAIKHLLFDRKLPEIPELGNYLNFFTSAELNTYFPGYKQLYERFRTSTIKKLRLMELFPERAREIINEYGHTLSLNEIADILQDHPELELELIETCEQKIKRLFENTGLTDVTTLRLLTTANFCKKQLEGMLPDINSEHEALLYLTTNPTDAAKCIKFLPSSIQNDKIMRVLAKNPNAYSLLKNFLKKPFTRYFLDNLLSVVSIDVVRQLIVDFRLEPVNDQELITVLSCFPEQFDDLIQLYGKFFENQSYELNVEYLDKGLLVKILDRYPKLRISNELERFGSSANNYLPRWVEFLRKRYFESMDDIMVIIEFYRRFEANRKELIEYTKVGHSFPDGSPNKYYNYIPPRFYCAPNYADEEETPCYEDCTSLIIGSLDEQLHIDFARFPNLEKITIITESADFNTLSSFFANLKEHCQKLQYLNLPEELHEFTASLPYAIKYKKVVNTSRMEVETSSDNDEVMEQPQLAAPGIGKQSSSLMYVADNKLGAKTLQTNSDSASTYTMVLAGEFLNPQSRQKHDIRTAVIEICDDFSTIKVREPSLRSASKPSAIYTNELVESLREKKDNNYYSFTVSGRAKSLARLISVDTRESLMAIDTEGVDYQLFRGDDDFYYIQPAKDTQISYIIEASEPLTRDKALAAFPESSIAIQLIKGYIENPEYRPTSKHRNLKRADEEITQWLDRLYKEASGNCVDRTMAVWYQLYKNIETRAKVRVVHINNNHRILEIQHQSDTWLPFDLGGREVNLEYDNRGTYNATVAPPAPRQQVVAVTETTPREATMQPHHDLVFESASFHKLEEYFKGNRALAEQSVYQILQRRITPTLIIGERHTEIANRLIQVAVNGEIPVFLLHSPAQIKVGKEQLHLANDRVEINTTDALDLFIEENKLNKSAVLIVDWHKFTPQERLALNTLIDAKASVYGKKIPFKIISICSQFPEDSSFISRHKNRVTMSLSYWEPDSTNNVKKYDLQGFPDWEEALFGPVVLHENKIRWSKSKFVQDLELIGAEKVSIVLTNYPEECRDEIAQLLGRAQAFGYFIYHHCYIPIPQNVQIELGEVEFDFTCFNRCGLATNVDLLTAPKETHVINTSIFDLLLANKEIKNGEYIQLVGLIERSKGQELALYITSSLSENQWYCLLTQAREYNVELALYTSPSVEIPKGLKSYELQKTARKEEIQTYIVVSNAPAKLLPAREEAYCFAVEDYSYQDLVDHISYKYDGKCFSDFKEEESDLMRALRDGKNVILYGEFSKELLEALEPIIIKQYRENQAYGKLSLIIDAKSKPNLTYLPKDKVVYENLKQEERATPSLVYAEKDITDENLEDSTTKAKEYMDGRLSALKEALDRHNIVHLSGKTGVGKTFLVRGLKQHFPEDYELYNELESFKAFANDTSDKVKILFLDEVNIANLHLTMLNPMLKDTSSRVLYKGKVYVLSNKHKIICASNPLEYGGGRVEQKLFADKNIALLELNDLPNYYIYEEVLKPLYERVQRFMPESDFKEKCAAYIEKYKIMRTGKRFAVCVRDLQEWVLQYVFQQEKKIGFFTKTAQKEFAKAPELTITPSMLPISKALRKAIEVRKQRFIYKSQSVMGLNGCLLEGKPGTGKSELVKLRLKKAGYKKINPDKDVPPGELGYIKIDASLPDSLKKDYVRRAFNQGHIVWLDELNSVVDDGFEKWMNAFLSGFDPDTHAKAKIPGFMLLVTANSIGIEGRSLISPALRGRLTELQMPTPELADIRAIVDAKVTNDTINDEEREQMAVDIYVLLQQKPELTLREVAPKILELAEIYTHQVRPKY